MCIHKEPNRRYQSAKKPAHNRRRAVNGETIAAQPTGRLETLRLWRRRKPASVALVSSLTVVAFAAGFLPQTVLAQRCENAGRRAATLDARTSTLPEDAPSGVQKLDSVGECAAPQHQNRSAEQKRRWQELVCSEGFRVALALSGMRLSSTQTGEEKKEGSRKEDLVCNVAAIFRQKCLRWT